MLILGPAPAQAQQKPNMPSLAQYGGVAQGAFAQTKNRLNQAVSDIQGLNLPR